MTKLGSVERKALKLLATNPDQHAQTVQRMLNIPERNYTSVLDTMKRLFKKGFLKSKRGISEKNNPIKIYRLTDEGLNLVLINEDFSSIEIDKIIENYSEDVQTHQLLKKQHKALGTQVMVKLLRTYANMGMMKSKGLKGQRNMMLVSTFVAGLTQEDVKKMDDFIDSFTKEHPRLKKKVRAYLKKRKLL